MCTHKAKCSCEDKIPHDILWPMCAHWANKDKLHGIHGPAHVRLARYLESINAPLAIARAKGDYL